MTHLAVIGVRPPGLAASAARVLLTLALWIGGWAIYRSPLQQGNSGSAIYPESACQPVSTSFLCLHLLIMISNLHNCQPRAAGPPGTTHSRSHSSCGYRDTTDANFSPPTLARRVCTPSSPGPSSHVHRAGAARGEPSATGLPMAGVLGQACGRGKSEGVDCSDCPPWALHTLYYTDTSLCCGSFQVSETEVSPPRPPLLLCHRLGRLASDTHGSEKPMSPPLGTRGTKVTESPIELLYSRGDAGSCPSSHPTAVLGC